MTDCKNHATLQFFGQSWLNKAVFFLSALNHCKQNKSLLSPLSGGRGRKKEKKKKAGRKKGEEGKESERKEGEKHLPLLIGGPVDGHMKKLRIQLSETFFLPCFTFLT